MYAKHRLDRDLREYTSITRHGVAVEGREIRSHRAPHARRHRVSFIATAALAIGALALTTGITRQYITSDTPVAAAVKGADWRTVIAVPEPPIIGPEPQEPVQGQERVSREQTRKVTTTRIEIVIAYALAQLGDPYRWATAGPNAFDCSGLVKAAFSRVGVTLPHYTGAIIQRGSRVNRSSLQRGDIVFPASNHVGIYLGGNRFVHASSSRKGVVVSTLYSFYAARRIAV